MEERGMADASQKLSITYSSGLIPPPELMSTLTVFYDKIWLPYPFSFDLDYEKSIFNEDNFEEIFGKIIEESENEGSENIEIRIKNRKELISLADDLLKISLELNIRDYIQNNRSYHLLFEENILQVLDEPEYYQDNIKLNNLTIIKLNNIMSSLFTQQKSFDVAD
jgi:hypothetical protein